MDAHKDLSRKELLTETQKAREDLYETLGQLTERLNFAQRFDDAVDRTVDRVKKKKRENPLGFAAGVVTAASLAGLAAWSIATAILRGR